MSSRTAEACEPVADAIRAAGGEAHVIPCNISRRPEIEALVAGARDRFGRIDILVCNAAVNPVFGPMRELTRRSLRQDHGREREEQRSGSAISSSPTWPSAAAVPWSSSPRSRGLRGTEMIGAYGISKAADFALARNLAVEWGPRNVRVNCIAPGLIKTEFARALWEDETNARAAHRARRRLRRIGAPEEIGGVAAFLASPAASFITGQVVVVDGGVTIA